MPEKDRDQNGQGESNGDAKEMVLSALRSKELLVPAAISAAGTVAATKGPDVVRRIMSSTEEKGDEQAERLGKKAVEGAKSAFGGGGQGLAGKMLSKVGGAGSTKKTRRLPIQRWTDVAVSVDKAYEAWTKFDRFPRFMHRVLDVQKEGRDRIRWQEKIWFSKRQWEGEITDRRKNDRIAWKTTSGMSHHGVVSFHKLGDNLTRVMIDMEFEPNGMIEKMASGLRFVKRAVQSDLARFKAYVEMEDAKGIQYRDGQQDEKQGESRDDGDDGERSRREREKRREERRKSLSSK
jgi:uncharacterized membrane protein